MILFKTILVLLGIFALLVGIHELGHFLAAKLQGVWVQEFAFGFGPKLFRKKIGETEYRLNLIPLGGYVKLHGEKKIEHLDEINRKFEELDDSEEDRLKGLIDKYNLKGVRSDDNLRNTIIGLDELGDSDKEWLWLLEINSKERINDTSRYANKSIFQRLIIICSGVIMNFILGVVLIYIYMILVNWQTVLFKLTDYNFIGVNEHQIKATGIFYTYKNELSKLENSIIISIDDEVIQDVDSLNKLIEEKYNEEILIKIYKFEKGKIIEENVVLDSEGFDTNLDSNLRDRVILSTLSENQPASNSRLKQDDLILEINDVNIQNAEFFQKELKRNEGENVRIKILSKEGMILNINAVLNVQENEDDPILGASFSENINPGLNLYYLDYRNNKISAGFSHALNMMGYQFKGLQKIIKISFEEKDVELLSETVGGPIRIGAELKNLVEFNNFIDILNLTALISLSLAFMNILPLPVLDGGHVVLLIIEKVIGKPLSQKSLEIFNFVGISFFLILTIVITLKDIWQVFIR